MLHDLKADTNADAELLVYSHELMQFCAARNPCAVTILRSVSARRTTRSLSVVRADSQSPSLGRGRSPGLRPAWAITTISPTTALFTTTGQGFIPWRTGNARSGHRVSTPYLGGLRTPTPTRRYRTIPEPARGWPDNKTLGPASPVTSSQDGGVCRLIGSVARRDLRLH